jgi:positive regulator of sigma E activity
MGNGIAYLVKAIAFLVPFLLMVFTGISTGDVFIALPLAVMGGAIGLYLATSFAKESNKKNAKINARITELIENISRLS